MSDYKGVCNIDPTTIIGYGAYIDTCKIQAGCIIGHNLLASKLLMGESTFLGKGCNLTNVKIGSNCEIGSYLTGEDFQVDDNVLIGRNVTIYQNSKIGAHCCLGNHVIIEENVTIHPQVTIGSGSKIESGAVIKQGARILEYSYVGAESVIEQFVRIGQHIVEGANITRNNIIIHGLPYPICDAGDGQINIGCTTHNVKTWKKVGPKMAKEEGVNFNVFKEAVELLIKLRNI